MNMHVGLACFMLEKPAQPFHEILCTNFAATALVPMRIPSLFQICGVDVYSFLLRANVDVDVIVGHSVSWEYHRLALMLPLLPELLKDLSHIEFLAARRDVVVGLVKAVQR